MGGYISRSMSLYVNPLQITCLFCILYRDQDRMKRLLVQILCITNVLLCAADSPPLSEDMLKSEAFMNRKHFDVLLTDIGCKTE